MALVRYVNLIIGPAGANDEEFFKIAEVDGAVRDLRFGLMVIAYNPDFVCLSLASPQRVNS